MIKLVPSTDADRPLLEHWIKSDPYHCNVLHPMFWLTGSEGSLLAFTLIDEKGIVCFVRLDEKNSSGLIRLHTQFGPTSEVPRLRLTKGMLQCVPKVIEFSKRQQANGIIFESESPTLIGFMQKKFGFQPAGGTDYIMPLQVGV